MAAEEAEFTLVDASDVVSTSDLDLFAEDRVHPSEEGSEVIGAYLAQSLP